MRFTIYTLLLSVLFICTGKTGRTQDSTARPESSATLEKSDTSRKTASYFEVSMNYQSNNVYLGRKDSSALPYFIPMLSYYHKSGVYITASAAYLKNSTANRIDVVTLEAGYSFSAGYYSGDFTATKYFYNNQSTSVTAAIAGAVSYQNSYNFGFVKPTVTATINFGKNTDIETAFGLEHSFYLLGDKLEIIPAFTANASTLNYYSNYYRTRRFSKRKAKKTVTGTVDITGTVVNPSEFRILDYEPSLPISYKTGKFTFSFTPTYTIPVNPAAIDLHYVYSTGTVADKTNTEKLGNSFFWTLGLSYRF
jgi:hypothetical protein